MQTSPAKPESDYTLMFPARTILVRVGRWLVREEVIQIKPFTVRQLMCGVINPGTLLQIATGKPAWWLKRVVPQDLLAIGKLIEELNAWDPHKLVEQSGKDKEGKPYDFNRCVALLVAAGHNPETVLDLTPPQFMFFVNEIIKRESRRESVQAVLAADGVAAAIASSFSKEGGRILEEFRRALLKKAGES